MPQINTLAELQAYIEVYEPDTLVGQVRIGGELLAEAAQQCLCITGFCTEGDEGEAINIDADGNVLSDFLYY